VSTSVSPKNGVFDPKTTDAMTAALDQICEGLHITATDIRSREIVAARLFDLARAGDNDPLKLCDRVLREARAPE